MKNNNQEFSIKQIRFKPFVTSQLNCDMSKMLSLMEQSFSFSIEQPLFGKIVKVIFNDPATIVFWDDGKKTVVKCQGGDKFDEEKGLAMAIAKRALGNEGGYYDVFKKFCVQTKKDEDEKLYVLKGHGIQYWQKKGLILKPCEITKNGIYVMLNDIFEYNKQILDPFKLSELKIYPQNKLFYTFHMIEGIEN